MEQCVQKPFRIFIKTLAYTVYGYMIVNKFNLALVGFESLFNELLLVAIETMKISSV